jgi:urease accessory protein
MAREQDSGAFSSPGLALLRLLHLADSALPIGSLAHSFGLESLAAEGILQPAQLENFFRDYLEETGLLETVYCRRAFRLLAGMQGVFPAQSWRESNDALSARMPAREIRAASGSLGRNFLQLICALEDSPAARAALDAAKAPFPVLTHHATSFGLVSCALGFDEDAAVAAFLHQFIANLISACQRLMPLGQTAAGRILWNLKPAMLEAAARSRAFAQSEASDEPYSFTPLPDWAGMEHPALATRLFVS